MVIRLFDPWRSELCTCPTKYSLNPYTGCGHACIYCYITSYIPRAFNPRPKKNLIKSLIKEKERLDKKIFVALSNSSDPYQPLEKELRLTRACLKILREFKKLIVTKSDLVVRDLDLLDNASVSITITTLDNNIARKLEPNAPSPERRLKALEKLVSKLKVSVRVDPIIPHINDEVEELIKELSNIGVSQVISSTFKPRWDSWKRFEAVFPNEAKKLKEFYFKKGKRYKNAYYLPKELRFKLMKKVRRTCDKYNLSFSTCREGFKLNTARTCDGSHLIGQIPQSSSSQLLSSPIIHHSISN